MAMRLLREVEVRTPETLAFRRLGRIVEIVRGEDGCMDVLRVPEARWGQGDKYALASVDPAGDEMRGDLMTIRDGEKGKIYVHDRPSTLCVDDWLWVVE